MAIKYIKPVEPSFSVGLTAEVYAQIRRDFGAVVEPFALHSPLPELLAGAWSACRETLLAGRVRRNIKEAVAATVSRTNGCSYCLDAHAVMLGAADAVDDADAISLHRDELIEDAVLRSVVSWAGSTLSPGAGILLEPPFSHQEAPEIIGTAVFFHYINRMAAVLLGETPLPSSHERLKKPLKRMAGWFFSRAVHRSKPQGLSLRFLPDADLPSDLSWARPDSSVAGAFARLAEAIDAAACDSLPGDMLSVVRERVEAWNGADPGIGQGWIELAISSLDEPSKAAGRLVLLTALAPYRAGEGVIQDFRTHFPGDHRLLSALAWGSFTAARRIGTWLSITTKTA